MIITACLEEVAQALVRSEAAWNPPPCSFLDFCLLPLGLFVLSVKLLNRALTIHTVNNTSIQSALSVNHTAVTTTSACFLGRVDFSGNLKKVADV